MTLIFLTMKCIYLISTHTLTWSVTEPYSQLSVKISDFNSHAHVERDYTTGAGTAIVFNFNSHAHVERDAPDVQSKFYDSISTHTLTWSVTRGALVF